MLRPFVQTHPEWQVPADAQSSRDLASRLPSYNPLPPATPPVTSEADGGAGTLPEPEAGNLDALVPETRQKGRLSIDQCAWLVEQQSLSLLANNALGTVTGGHGNSHTHSSHASAVQLSSPTETAGKC